MKSQGDEEKSQGNPGGFYDPNEIFKPDSEYQIAYTPNPDPSKSNEPNIYLAKREVDEDHNITTSIGSIRQWTGGDKKHLGREEVKTGTSFAWKENSGKTMEKIGQDLVRNKNGDIFHRSNFKPGTDPNIFMRVLDGNVISPTIKSLNFVEPDQIEEAKEMLRSALDRYPTMRIPIESEVKELKTSEKFNTSKGVKRLKKQAGVNDGMMQKFLSAINKPEIPTSNKGKDLRPQDPLSNRRVRFNPDDEGKKKTWRNKAKR